MFAIRCVATKLRSLDVHDTVSVGGLRDTIYPSGKCNSRRQPKESTIPLTLPETADMLVYTDRRRLPVRLSADSNAGRPGGDDSAAVGTRRGIGNEYRRRGSTAGAPNCLVTGGTKGIGKATAATMAGEGCRVAIVARSKSDLESIAEDFEKEGLDRPVLIAEDLDSTGATDANPRASRQSIGDLDILINNAGGARYTAVWVGRRVVRVGSNQL